MFNGDPTVLDPGQTSWVSYRNLTSDDFSGRFEALADDYMMTDIEIDEINGTERVSGVWIENSDNRGWAERRNLTHSEFHDKWTHYRDKGFRLIDQESYVLSGNRYYAGVWIENKEDYAWASFRNLTSSEFSKKFDQYNDNFLMVDFEAYEYGNSTRYAAAWVENTEDLAWTERRDLTDQQFKDYFQQYEDDYRITDIESYQINGEQRYAAIWVENTNDRGWIEYRDMTATDYRNRWYRYRDLGYRLVDFEVYDTANGLRYAGVWRQNSDRPDWELRDDVDDLVQQEVDLFNVPGMSVAIAKAGEIKYMRGFGHQDVADNVWYSARTVNRLASVAKTVAGVVTLGLEEDGVISDIDAATKSFVTELPNHHDHTLRQLLANRSGVGHYNDHGSSNQQYDTALEASQFFWNDALPYGTGVACKYSTHGYTILGAALEGATGKPIGDIIEDELSSPYGLSSLQPEDRGDGNKNRSTLYNNDNTEATPGNISWKVLGGGLEASSYDMVRLGMKMLNENILDESTLDELATVPVPTSCVDPAHSNHSNYALGLRTGTHKGSQWVGKGGNQTGANTYLRMYPEHDIAIIVLSNRNGGGHSASQVATGIGALLLDYDAEQGDVNNDGTVDANDIDALTLALRTGLLLGTHEYDTNNDGVIGYTDRNYLVQSILGTHFGDVNLSGKIDFPDFSTISANYGMSGAGWADGDVDGDGNVGFGDFVIVSGNYGNDKVWRKAFSVGGPTDLTFRFVDMGNRQESGINEHPGAKRDVVDTLPIRVVGFDDSTSKPQDDRSIDRAFAAESVLDALLGPLVKGV